MSSIPRGLTDLMTDDEIAAAKRRMSAHGAPHAFVAILEEEARRAVGGGEA